MAGFVPELKGVTIWLSCALPATGARAEVVQLFARVGVCQFAGRCPRQGRVSEGTPGGDSCCESFSQLLSVHGAFFPALEPGSVLSHILSGENMT